MFLVVDCDLKKLKIWGFQESRKGLSVKFFTEDLDELTDVANLQRYIYKISGRVNIKAISFRILFGGDYFKKAELVNSSFLRKFEKLTEFFPFYIPTMSALLKKFLKIFKQIPLIAFFETAFFTKLPNEERYYALPFEYHKKIGIKKWGFHGIFHEANAQILPHNYKIISIVIDKQTTVCSISRNRPLSISLGYTPLEGIMSRRSCGDIDPGIVFYLMKTHNFSIYQIDEILKNKSGFLGLTGYDIELSDMFKLRGKDAKVDLAFDVYQTQIIKHIGKAITILGELDAIVFAGGYLTTVASLIRDIIKQISFLGIHTVGLPWDESKKISIVTSKESKIKVYINKMELPEVLYRQTQKFLQNIT